MIRAFVLLALPDRRSPCWLKQLCMPANLEARFFVISIILRGLSEGIGVCWRIFEGPVSLPVSPRSALCERKYHFLTLSSFCRHNYTTQV